MASRLSHKEDESPLQVDQVDEGYWSAILSEGEYAKTAYEAPPHLDNQEPSGHQEITAHSENLDFDGESIESDWDDIHRIQEQDEVLHLTVVGYNRGGLLVEWQSIRGFVPASQLVHFPANGSPYTRQNALLERVGDELDLRVIELNPEKRRLILSERAAQVEQGKREAILHELQPGDTTTGFITNLCDFGAFVDLGGVEGLIHISELSWGRVGHPADMLTRGEKVKVHVLDVSFEEARIALSLKRLHPDPWETVATRFTINDVVEGRITNVVDFGAFAKIEDGLEGLIHFSELAEGHFLHPRNVVAEGDIVRARVLSIDAKSRRLGLSLRLV